MVSLIIMNYKKRKWLIDFKWVEKMNNMNAEFIMVMTEMKQVYSIIVTTNILFVSTVYFMQYTRREIDESNEQYQKQDH